MNTDNPRNATYRQPQQYLDEGQTRAPDAPMTSDRSPDEIEAEIAAERARMGDTLEAIQRRLSPGQLLDQVLDYTKRGSGDYVANLGASVRDNPLPATLVAVGLAWLMASGTGTHMRSAEHIARPRAADDESSTGRIKGAAERASSAVSDVVHRVGDAARSVRESVSGAAHSARESVGHARESGSHAGERMREQGRHARDSAKHYAERASSGWSYMATEQPLVLGAIGVAIGAALGAGLPSTRREDELLGEYRDELVDRATETGKEQLERGKRVATAAVSAAASEVDRKARSAEAGDDTTGAGPGGMEAVAKAAAAAAKGEAERQGILHIGSGSAMKSGTAESAQATSTSGASGIASGSSAATTGSSPSAQGTSPAGASASASGATPASTKSPGSR
ncbi:DUF3618 domain-containing protein [Aromatoleum buckelii]|nr:DUF3618 domain-containing protein [Aromatoleum buckelii]MCK0511398.1 DUF3618 domain-containing protein [Aromatoleum buckelii]